LPTGLYHGSARLRRAGAGRHGGPMLDNTTSVVLLILIVALYMLPTLIAFARDHPRRGAITLVNVLFGWTLIVWIIVFVWALMTPSNALEIS
jgi:hypothetical protein